MLVREAKEIARAWVDAASTSIPGFQGAFYHGSVNWLSDDAVLPATSDLDVMIVLDDTSVPDKPGKLVYCGLLLEASLIAADELQSPEQVLARSDLAGSFAAPGVIADPTGQLTELQDAVSRDYAKRRWVHARCEHAQAKVINNLQALKSAELFHDQVTYWLFATGVTTHVLLVAGLQNPTVRKRYSDARRLLAEYGRLDFYESLLTLLGCERMSRGRVEAHGLDGGGVRCRRRGDRIALFLCLGHQRTRPPDRGRWDPEADRVRRAPRGGLLGRGDLRPVSEGTLPRRAGRR